MKDDADRMREGTLPADPEADTVPMRAPPKPAAPADPFEGKWIPLASKGWLDEAPPPERWLLMREPAGFGALRLGKVGLLVAGGGVGKTQSLMQLAIAIATGRPWLHHFRVASEGRVLLALAEEDAEEAQRRLWFACKGLEPAQVAKVRERIVVAPLAGVSVGLVTHDPAGQVIESDVLQRLRVRLREHRDWRLIALDPLSRWAGAETETDNYAATRFIEAAETLTSDELGAPTVLLAHHSTKEARTKPGASTPRGASALHDGARWVAVLEDPLARDDGDVEDDDTPAETLNVVRFKITKSNYGRKGSALLLGRDDGRLRPATKDEIRLYREAIKRARASESGASSRTRRDNSPASRGTPYVPQVQDDEV